MRVLMLTQKVDPEDSALAFTVEWINALASRVEHLDVLCLERHQANLLPNVTVWSMGKDRGKNRLKELMEFYKALAHITRNVDVIFCHMIPRYAVLAAPLTALFRKPIILWYTHRQISAELRLALTFSKYVATAVPQSFPIQTPKLRALGHGIDDDFYQPDPNCEPDSPPLIVHVARLMPIKHQATLINALTSVQQAKAAFVGEVLQGQDNNYLIELQALADDLSLFDRVIFTGRQNRDAVRDLYRYSSIAVNLSPDGLFDKAALESMLVGTPTIVSNPAFDHALGEYASMLRINGPEDHVGLANRLRLLLELPATDRETMTRDIRQRVREMHSLNGLMDRLVTLFAEAQ